jgi:hypothetical protein
MFPLFRCRDNLQRVADILVKFPREQLSVLDEPYDYQVCETDMSCPITRVDLLDVRVSLMNEIRDLKYTVSDSQEKMDATQEKMDATQEKMDATLARVEAVLTRVELCLNGLSR